MSIEINYMDNGMGIVLIGKGTVAGREIMDAKRRIFSTEEKMKKYRYGLIDFSGVDDLKAYGAEVDGLVQLDRDAAEIIPEAVVAIAAEKDIAFGLSRMWQAYMGGIPWEINVFRSRNEAEVWIRETLKAKFGIDPAMA